MDDLIAFVEARLAEEAAEARKHQRNDGEWARVICDPIIGPYGGQTRTRNIAAGLYVAAMSDPARVLREVAAKRAILTRYGTASNQVAAHVVNGNFAEAEAWEKIAGGLELDVRSTGTVWSDHADYRQEWAP